MLAKAAGDGDGGDGAGGGDAEEARLRMLATAMVVTALVLAVPLQPLFLLTGDRQSSRGHRWKALVTRPRGALALALRREPRWRRMVAPNRGLALR